MMLKSKQLRSAHLTLAVRDGQESVDNGRQSMRFSLRSGEFVGTPAAALFSPPGRS